MWIRVEEALGQNLPVEGLEQLPNVVVVRADAPALTIGPYQDAQYLRLATPTREVKQIGDVQCEINWVPPTVAGQKVDPETEIVTNCQRTGGGRTAFVYGGGAFKGPSGEQQIVGLTDAAWQAAQG